MTPESTLFIKMPGIFYLFLARHELIEKEVHQDNIGVLLIEHAIEFGKVTSFGDLDSMERVKLEVYTLLAQYKIPCGVDEVNEILVILSETLLNEIVNHGLFDYIHYVMALDKSKIVLRAYKLDRDLDPNVGVEEII